MKNRVITFFIVMLMIIFLVGAYYMVKIFLPPYGTTSATPIEVKIKPGLTVTAIAETLESKGIIKRAEDFIFTTKLFGNVARLKAGRYHLPQRLSVYRAMNIIVAGKTAHTHVVIPEGLTSFEIAGLLAHKLEIDSTRFIDLLYDPQFISGLGLQVNSLEGYLFPNTYAFNWGITEQEIIQVMIREFNRNFTDSLKNIVMEKGWTVHQILTLASIIEGEAMKDSERPLISAVYHNRLKRGILLQADPTIQYIIPDGPRRLLKKDLEIDSPYNTYRYRGLSPGPVNNPGLKSILAAIQPAPVDYIYFVAKGDGSHIFSTTLNEHLVAKAKFDDYRRMIKRQKRLNHHGR